MVAVSEIDLFFCRGGTALRYTICLVMCECPTEVGNNASIPLLRQEGIFCVLKSETDRFLSGLLKVCLLVCGVVQNQRSLNSWGEAWLLVWQYQHLTAEINTVWGFSHHCCVQAKPRTERSLLLWYVFIHEDSIAPSASEVHALSVQSSVSLLQ